MAELRMWTTTMDSILDQIRLEFGGDLSKELWTNPTILSRFLELSYERGILTKKPDIPALTNKIIDNETKVPTVEPIDPETQFQKWFGGLMIPSETLSNPYLLASTAFNEGYATAVKQFTNNK